MTGPEALICSECGGVTHDDESAVFVDYGAGGDSRRVCFRCCPPDSDE